MNASFPHMEKLQKELRRRVRQRENLREQLRERLLQLSSSAFEQLVAQLLEACGYDQVQVLCDSVGKPCLSTGLSRHVSTSGRADLKASTPHGLGRVLTLVQVKQYRVPVSRRFVDELRGAMLRLGAQQGLLLTVSTFYAPAHHAVFLEGVAPVRLVDGKELLDLLIAHRIGVQEVGLGKLKLNQELFALLEQQHVRTNIVGNEDKGAGFSKSDARGRKSSPSYGAKATSGSTRYSVAPVFDWEVTRREEQHRQEQRAKAPEQRRRKSLFDFARRAQTAEASREQL